MNSLRHIGIVLALCIASISVAQTSAAAPNTGESTYRIFGVVVDLLSNQPIAGARVIISPVAERGSTRTVKTSSNGSFLFDRLSRGKYSLGAESHGYPIQGYDQHEAYATAIAVGPNLDSEHIVFRLRPGSAIRGTITNDENEPVESANVRLFYSSVENGRPTIRMMQAANTDDRGYYYFVHLREGNYYIAVSGHPWYAINSSYVEQARAQGADSETLARIEQEASRLDVVYPLTFYSGALSSDEATPIQLEPGQSVTADLSLNAVRPVRIRVPVPAQPEPVNSEPMIGRIALRQPPQVRVTQMVFGEPVGIDAGMSGSSNSPTQFELTGVPPGHYSLIITQPGKDESTSRTQEVNLSDDIELATAGGVSSANVTGVVFSDDPQEQPFVRLFAKDQRRSYPAPIADGKFRIAQPVPPGTYEVGVGSASDEFYLKSLSATGAKVKGRSIQIDAGQPVELSLTLGRGMSRIDGLATKGGKPFAGAMILLVPCDLETDSVLIRRDQSDSDGTFTLGPVVPGKYKVVAIQDGWKISWAAPKTIQPYLNDVPEVNVSGATTMNVKVEVQSVK